MFDIYGIWHYIKIIFVQLFYRFESLIFTKQVSSRPFPSDVLKWMKTNSNPRMSHKLVKVCKYFQRDDFQYLVIRNINVYRMNKQDRYIFDGDDFQKEDLDFNNVWASNSISAKDCDIKSLFPMIAVFGIKRLYLHNQDLLIPDFQLLTSSRTITVFYLVRSKLKNENGEIITFEEMLKFLPKVEFIEIRNHVPSIISFNAFKNAASPKLQTICLLEIGETFNFENFFIFMRKFQQNSYYVSFIYHTPELIAAIKKVVCAWMPKYVMPKISYVGYQDPKLIKLREKHNKARNWWLDSVNS